MNTTSNTIVFASITGPHPLLDKLRWAIYNEIDPATAVEENLVERLARHLWGMRDIPSVKNALFPWLRTLDNQGNPVAEDGSSFRSPRTNVHTGEDEQMLYFAFSGNFLLSPYASSRHGENGHVSTERAVLMLAFECVFLGDYDDEISGVEADHVRKYRASARRLGRLIDERRPGTPIEEWIWKSQMATIVERLSGE